MTRLSQRLLSALIATALCLLPGAAAWADPAPSLTVGAKDFTEQLIMAEMTRQLLQSKGYTVHKKDGMGTKIVRAALENGEVDLYWEYTGTSLVIFNKVTQRLSPQDVYQKVRELDGKKGLVWLAPSKVNSTYAVVVRPDNPKTDGMKTISDLAAGYKTGNALAMGMTAEFPKRLDGLIGLQKTYGFEAGRANVRPMQLNLAYNALANGDLDTVVAQATDGQIVALNLRMLADDAGFFPNYAMTPVIRQKVLDAHPGLKAVLESISMKLDDATMQRLNSEVDVRRKPIEAVAKSYLEEAGLL